MRIPEDILALYQDQHRSARSIGNKYGVSGIRVKKWLQKLGVEIRPLKRNPPPEDIKYLYLVRGWSQEKISNKYQVSQVQVSRWLRRLRVPTRFSDKRNYRGPNHPGWKGGKKRSGKNKERIKIWKPDHPRADGGGYVYRQILVWEKYRGPIPEGYLVHHLNGIKDDDRIGNFLLLKKSDHSPWLTLQAAQDRIRKLERKILKLGGKL